MILQDLVQYYEDNSNSLAPFGFEYKDISFVILLSEEGAFLDIQDMRKLEEGKKQLVPQSVKRSGTASNPNYLWDNAKYVFGIGECKNSQQKTALKQKRISFLQQIKQSAKDLPKSKELKAVIRFLESNHLTLLQKHPLWNDLVTSNAYISFSVAKTGRLVCQEPSIAKAFSGISEKSEQPLETCILTGKKGPIARLHPLIQGIYGAQGSGAALVSYNMKSSESFGKEQGYNALMSQASVFSYGVALNVLLNSPQKVIFHEAMTVIFWSQKKTSFETVFTDFLKRNLKKADFPFLSQHVEEEEDSFPFYIYALSPQGARLSLRLSWRGSVGDIKRRIRKLFEELELMNHWNPQEKVSMHSLMQAFSPHQDIKNAQPHLLGEFFFNFLNDLPYPQSLLALIAGKLSDKEGISHRRVALMKAYLNQRSDISALLSRLDLSNHNTAYLLGRLFSVLEIARKQARKTWKTQFVDSFYRMASTSPKKIFPHLLKLYLVHASSLSSSCHPHFQSLRDSLLASITDFPSNLSLCSQCEFTVGYYHQKQELFTK